MHTNSRRIPTGLCRVRSGVLCPPSNRSLHCLLVLHYLLYFTSTKVHAFFFCCSASGARLPATRSSASTVAGGTIKNCSFTTDTVPNLLLTQYLIYSYCSMTVDRKTLVAVTSTHPYSEALASSTDPAHKVAAGWLDEWRSSYQHYYHTHTAS